MKEVRAIVIGLIVVVVAAVMLAFWRRPAPEFTRIKEFRVQVKNKDGDATRMASFTVPTNLLARLAKLAHLESIGGDIATDWGRGNVTVHDLLEAADRSEPGKPGIIQKDDSKIEVADDGGLLTIDVHDGWDKNVHVKMPRAIVEGLSGEHGISVSEILRRLDGLDPGDVVTIRDSNSEVTITAVPRKHRGLTIS
ncbi:MAG: hypothetical protein ABI968_13770 [Acidobacteriota bacterium]